MTPNHGTLDLDQPMLIKRISVFLVNFVIAWGSVSSRRLYHIDLAKKRKRSITTEIVMLFAWQRHKLRSVKERL